MKFTKEHIPWNKGFFEKGHKKGMTGRHHSEKTKQKIGDANRNKIPSNKGIHKLFCKTLLGKRIRELNEYNVWRLSIFKRDNYTCQRCKARNGNGKTIYLEAHHHLKSFYRLLEENNIKIIKDAVKCNALWSIDNGQTLCKNCHKLTKRRAKYV